MKLSKLTINNFYNLLEKSNFVEYSQNLKKGNEYILKCILYISEGEYKGYWETNEFVYDDLFGYDINEIVELTKVNPKTQESYKIYWENV